MHRHHGCGTAVIKKIQVKKFVRAGRKIKDIKKRKRRAKGWVASNTKGGTFVPPFFFL